MNILSHICDICPSVKYMMSCIHDNHPMSVNKKPPRLGRHYSSALALYIERIVLLVYALEKHDDY